MWFIGLFLFTAQGYVSTPIVPFFETEQQCREAASKMQTPEMPPTGTPLAQMPPNGWRCMKT